MGQISPIDGIKSIDINTVYKVLSSQNITDGQKIQFMKNNSSEIHKVVELAISSKDFKTLMGNRPLIKFRPLKNSFTKRGDKKLLAMSLGIEPTDVDDYIKDITLSIADGNIINYNSLENIETVKSYVYRHGKKEQVTKFLDYELNNAKNILKVLYKTLEYNSGGVADYYMRPIHRLDNNTMYQIYNTVDKNLKNAQQNGQITDTQYSDTTKWALLQIYRIQNNQRLINAVKIKQATS